MNQVKGIILNAKLGDGGIVHQGHTNAYMRFTSTNIELLNLKREMCKEYSPSNFREIESGYTKGKRGIFTFYTRSHEDITKVYYMSYAECVRMLEKEDLIMWYLDDGSFHQKKHYMHLYCNMFNEEETNLLADRVFELYPIKRPVMLWDRKKDGRKYAYLYIPVATATAFKKDVREFIEKHELPSLLYKVGA